jgi:hypothetical protein
VLFGKTEKDINHSSVTNTEYDLRAHTAQVSTFDKEDTEKYVQEENDTNFVEVNHIKEEPHEDLVVENLIDKDSIFSEKEDRNANKETSNSKHTPIKEILKKMSNEKQKFIVKCSSCDFVTNCSFCMSNHTSTSHRNINYLNYY